MPETLNPALSVLLPVYNGLPYLEESINSILSQSFRDFELIIIDDGSLDGSASIVQKFDDPRICFYEQENRGLAATLNRGIRLARGKYLARQDQDDISFSRRFNIQIEFLDANPDVAMVGAFAEIWVGDGRTNRLLTHPTDDASIRFSLLFDNYFVHSSVMMRRSVVMALGGYSEDKLRQPPEDYELWSRVMRENRVRNLPEVLLAYREVPNSISRVGVNPFLGNLVKISTENIAWASDFASDSPVVGAISNLFHGCYKAVVAEVKFSEMREVLQKAMLRIAEYSDVTPQHMMKISRSWINRLRYRYIDYCSGGLVGNALNGRLGIYVRNMVGELRPKR